MPDSFCWNQVRRFLLCFMFVLMSCSWRDFSSERWNEKTKSKWGMEVEQVYSRRKNEISCVWVIWFCSHPSNLFRWLADSSSTIIESRNFSDAAIEITTSEKNDSKRVNNYSFSFWGLNCVQSQEFFDLSRRLVSSKNWNLLCWSIRYVRRCPLDWRIWTPLCRCPDSDLLFLG